MNKTVQLVDSGGNSSTGIVAGYGVSNGELGLVINGRTREITAEWGNASDPAIEAEIEKALLPVLQRFTKTKGAPK